MKHCIITKTSKMYNIYKKIVLTISLLLIISCAFLTKQTHAQTRFPVNAFTQVLPPYSVYLNDYASIQAEKLAITLTLNDSERPMLDVRLKIIIQGNGIEISTKDNYIGRPITLHQNIPERISGAALVGYLDPYNLDFKGITRAEFLQKGSRLNEGLYQFIVKVYEARRGVEVSNPMDPRAKAMAMLILNSPPMWITPAKNEVLKATDPPNIMFSWLSMNSGSPNSAFTTEYEFRIAEVKPNEANPENIINTTTPIYKTTTTKTRLQYGADAPMLEPGHKYVCRLRAYDINGADIFKNNGYSEVLVFTFGKPCQPPININNGSTGKQDAEIVWSPFYDHTEFVVQYKEEGQDEWYQDAALNSPHKITGLNSAVRYQYQIKGVCGSLCSGYSAPRDFRTAAVENTQIDCDGNDNVPPIDGSPILEKLNVGDKVTIGGFSAEITKIESSTNGFSGECMVSNFWLFQMNAKFQNIKVNQSMQVTDGKISAIKSTVASSTITTGNGNGNGNGNGTGTGNDPEPGEDIIISNDTIITHDSIVVDDVYIDENGNIVITYDNESTETIEPGHVVEITDANGNKVIVNNDGSGTYNGQGIAQNSEISITKICIDKEKKKATIYNDKNKKRKVKIIPNLEVQDKSGIIYLVSETNVEVKKESSFVYPTLTKDGNCYTVGNYTTSILPIKIKQVCITDDGYIITDSDNKVNDYKGNNAIITDNTNTKISISSDYKVKIENSSGAQGIKDSIGNIIPDNWEKNNKCFKLKENGTGVIVYVEVHDVIEKICFDNERNRIIITDDTKKDYPYVTDALYLRDKLGYKFEIKDNSVRIIKEENRIVYPIIKKAGNCFNIQNVKPLKIDYSITSFCVNENNIKITGNKDGSAQEDIIEGLNYIITDKSNTKFSIVNAENVNIEMYGNSSVSDEVYTLKWIREGNCFKLIYEIQCEGNVFTYSGEVDFVFVFGNNLFIKDINGKITNLGIIRDVCIENKNGKGGTIYVKKAEGNEIKVHYEVTITSGTYCDGLFTSDCNVGDTRKTIVQRINSNTTISNFSIWNINDDVLSKLTKLYNGQNKYTEKDNSGNTYTYNDKKINLVITDYIVMSDPELRSEINNKIIQKRNQGPTIVIHIKKDFTVDIDIEDPNLKDKKGVEDLIAGIFEDAISGIFSITGNVGDAFSEAIDFAATTSYEVLGFMAKVVRYVRIPEHWYNKDLPNYNSIYQKLDILGVINEEIAKFIVGDNEVMRSFISGTSDDIWALRCGLWNGFVELAASIPELIGLIPKIMSQQGMDEIVSDINNLLNLEVEGCTKGNLLCIFVQSFSNLNKYQKSELYGEVVFALLVSLVEPEAIKSGPFYTVAKIVKTMDHISELFDPLQWGIKIVAKGTKFIISKGKKTISIILKSEIPTIKVYDVTGNIIELELKKELHSIVEKGDDVFILDKNEFKEYRVVIEEGGMIIFKSVDYSEFASTVNNINEEQLKLAYQLWGENNWEELYKLFNQKDGSILNDGWPPFRGFMDKESKISLKVGEKVDRYGGSYVDGVFTDKDKFVSPEDVLFENRSLPEASRNAPNMHYEVIKEIPNVKSGNATPWFHQPGKGVQHELPETIDDLVEGGYLKRVINILEDKVTLLNKLDEFKCSYLKKWVEETFDEVTHAKNIKNLHQLEESDFINLNSITGDDNRLHNQFGELLVKLSEGSTNLFNRVTGWDVSILKQLANDLDNAELFRTAIHSTPELADSWKILQNRPNLRVDKGALESLNKIKNNPHIAEFGIDDNILSSISGWGNSGVQVGYSEIIDNIDEFVTFVSNNNISCIDCDKFFSIFITSANNDKQAIFWILEDVAGDANTFANKSLRREVRVTKVDNSNGFIDVAVNNLYIEYKWYAGDKIIPKEIFVSEFIKRDIYNITNLNQLQWRIKGQKLTKSKVVEYLNSSKTELESVLDVEKVKGFFRSQSSLINEDNYIDFFISQINKDDVFNQIFK